MSFFDERGVVAIKLPISAFNRKFFLVLRFAHIDTVVDARRVANDKGRSVIRFCLGNCLDELRFVRAHGAFCDVNVFVSHGDLAKVFLLCEFAACREFCDRARRGGFTCLSAGVAVNFGVKDEDIYVFARRDNVVESAVADVVCPAVAAEDPNGFLDKAIFAFKDFFDKSVRVCACAFKRGDDFHEFRRGAFAAFGVVHVVDPVVAGFLAIRVVFKDEGELCNEVFQFVTSVLVSKVDAVAEFRVVLKQAVRPSGAVTFLVLRIRAGRRASAVD